MKINGYDREEAGGLILGIVGCKWVFEGWHHNPEQRLIEWGIYIAWDNIN